MQCVILAAGEGVRMRPLTLNTPKPMLRLLGRPLLEHILDSLPPQIDEVILVVGYLQQQIQDYFGDSFAGRSIKYVVQEKKLGTFFALKLCQPLLRDGRFLTLYADDIHGPDDLARCVESVDSCLLYVETDQPEKFGVIEIDSRRNVLSIEEKPMHPKSNLVLTGASLLDKTLFQFPARQHSNGEFYLTDSLAQMVAGGYKFQAIRAKFWLPIGYPDDLSRAAELFSATTQGR